MSLSHEKVRSKISAKIKTYILTRAELVFNLCYEIPCSRTIWKWYFVTKIIRTYREGWPNKAHPSHPFWQKSADLLNWPWPFRSALNRTPMQYFNSFSITFYYINTITLETYFALFIFLDFRSVHRGAFCQFHYLWIYYCHSSKSTRKETGKTTSVQCV